MRWNGSNLLIFMVGVREPSCSVNGLALKASCLARSNLIRVDQRRGAVVAVFNCSTEKKKLLPLQLVLHGLLVEHFQSRFNHLGVLTSFFNGSAVGRADALLQYGRSEV